MSQVSVLRGERYRIAAFLAEGGASIAALFAIFMTGGLGLPPAAGLALLLGAIGMGLRAALGAVDGGAGARDPNDPQVQIALRLAPFYVFALAAIVMLFPDPFGPRALFLLAFAQVPLVGFSSLGRIRAAAEINGGVLISAANAVGAPAFAVPATVAWLTLTVAGIALRNIDARSDAAGRTDADDLRPALAATLAATAVLVCAYLMALQTVPAPHVRLPAVPMSPTEVLRPVVFPWRALVQLAAMVAVLVGLVWLYHKMFRREGRFRLEREGDDGDVVLGATEALSPAARSFASDVPSSGRAAVVAAYRRFEEAAAVRELGRATHEGAAEHAAALAHQFPAARGDLAVVAGTFSRARYGAEEPPFEAEAGLRTAAERAMGRIDASDGPAPPGVEVYRASG